MFKSNRSLKQNLLLWTPHVDYIYENTFFSPSVEVDNCEIEASKANQKYCPTKSNPTTQIELIDAKHSNQEISIH